MAKLEEWKKKHYWWEIPFQKLWTKAVGTEGYDKEEWKGFEKILYKLAEVKT